MSTAEDPGMVGLGRVPGIEAGMGCLCRLCRCSSEDREPGTGLEERKRKEKKVVMGCGDQNKPYPASHW